MTSIIERLKMGTGNVKKIPFPGIDGSEIALRVLSNQENHEAIVATEQYFARLKMIIGSTTLDMYEDERSTQVLWRAMRDPDNPEKSVATSADELRRLITKVEKESLIAEYAAFEKECSPNFTAMTDEDFRSLWEDVRKNPKALSNDLSIGTSRGLINYLASLPVSSPTGSGST